MCTSKEEKVFRKEGKQPSKGEESFWGFITLAFFLSLIIFIITFVILIIRNDPLWYMFTTMTHKINQCCQMLTLVLLFLLLVSTCACYSSSYTLTLSETSLTYTSDSETTTLTLPCSSRIENDSIILANGDVKISLTYDEEEGAELLEFLKDIIN